MSEGPGKPERAFHCNGFGDVMQVVLRQGGAKHEDVKIQRIQGKPQYQVGLNTQGYGTAGDEYAAEEQEGEKLFQPHGLFINNNGGRGGGITGMAGKVF